jgi:CRISPR system Cascade subunit CasD
VVDVLTFALVAPIASFGDLAVGERRSSWDRPGRSAVLGLVGACLGVDRYDDETQGALFAGYRVAILCRASGRLLVDYHTAQMPPKRAGRRFATRAEELGEPDLSTVLTRRDYRTGAWHIAGVLAEPTARWTLEELQAAIRQPIFTTYLGRKSCPLGLPMSPLITIADDVVSALLERDARGPEAKFFQAFVTDPEPTRIAIDTQDMAFGDPRHRRTESRRDAPLSRRRWQFGLRQEAVLEP